MAMAFYYTVGADGQFLENMRNGSCSWCGLVCYPFAIRVYRVHGIQSFFLGRFQEKSSYPHPTLPREDDVTVPPDTDCRAAAAAAHTSLTSHHRQSTAATRTNMSRLVPLPLDVDLSFQYLDDTDTDTMLYDPLFDLEYDPKALDGLTGVPTRTTSTLTPTTLRNIEQTFLDLQSQAESHHNQAGFVPPVVQPVSHGNGLFMSVVDHKGWGGGSTVIGDSHSSNDSSITLRSTPSITPPATTRRNMGGRRPIKDKNISPEEEERRQVRRERNKLAAARCRKRRVDHTNELVEETEGLEEKKQMLQQEIQQLQMEKEDLEFILETHKANCRLKRADSPPDIKPFNINATKVMVSGMPVQVKEEPTFVAERKPSRPRPNSLAVASFNPRKPVTEVAGVPITTPTAGMPFNFESLMEGGTGLTPVSGPLVPSCGSQQRSGCVDLSSPDTLPTKLVSL